MLTIHHARLEIAVKIAIMLGAKSEMVWRHLKHQSHRKGIQTSSHGGGGEAVMALAFDPSIWEADL